MAELSGQKTLKQVVDELLFMTGQPKDNFMRYLQLAIRGFKEANILHLKGFSKVIKLTVSDIKTITLPDDYQSFVGVVVPINGEYWALSEKETLVFSQSGLTLDADDGEGVDIKDSYFFEYISSGGVNKEGYFKLEEKNNRIIINSVTAGSEVMLIYVSSGINEAGTNTYVPDRIIPMLHSYILYKDAMYHGQQYQYYQDEYHRELDKVKYIEMPGLSAFRDALYQTFNPLPKR